MTLIHDSIIGTRFLGHIEATEINGKTAGVIPMVTGSASHVANSEFLLFETMNWTKGSHSDEFNESSAVGK